MSSSMALRRSPNPALSRAGLEDAAEVVHHQRCKRFRVDVFATISSGRPALATCSSTGSIRGCWKSSCRGAERRIFQNGDLPVRIVDEVRDR